MLEIVIDARGALLELDATQRRLRPEATRPVMARAVTNTVRRHLFDLNRSRPNKLGGARTHFYRAAAGSLESHDLADGVTVRVAHRGMAQRYYGGTIKPTRAKVLTIPVHPEAHGKRAREFRDLEVIFGGSPPRPIGLGRKRTGSVAQRPGVARAPGPGLPEEKPEMLYIFKKSITQAADPSVLPADEQMLAAIHQALTASLST